LTTRIILLPEEASLAAAAVAAAVAVAAAAVVRAVAASIAPLFVPVHVPQDVQEGVENLAQDNVPVPALQDVARRVRLYAKAAAKAM